MGGTGEAGGFQWWVPHDRALRRSRAMFLLGVVVAALYAIAPFIVVALILHTEDSSWPAIGGLGLTLVVLAVVAAAAGVVAVVAWRGIPRATLRVAGVRAPSAAEARVAAAGLDSFALALGMRSPTVWVVDDRAPNAFACGRPGAPHVALTTGALGLPDDELAALCAFEITALTCKPYVYCTSAIDVVLFAEWCTRWLWQLAALSLLSAVVGVPAGLAAGITASIAVLVGVTRLALLVADRALPRLLDDAAQLVDLEAVRLTEQPAPFARLLNRLRDDHHRVGTRWQIAHLWFDRDEIEVSGARERSGRLLADFKNLVSLGVDPPALARHCERANPQGLHDRAQRALAQANGVSGPSHRARRRPLRR